MKMIKVDVINRTITYSDGVLDWVSPASELDIRAAMKMIKKESTEQFSEEEEPDFYVVKRTRKIDTKKTVVEWCNDNGWTHEISKRGRFTSEQEALKVVERHGGRVFPVFCKSRRSEPKMRERSSAWVLKRLAEGKVVMIERDDGPPAFYRWKDSDDDSRLELRFECETKWTEWGNFPSVHGKVMCRVAKSEEVPK